MKVSQGVYKATRSGTLEIIDEEFLHEDTYYEALQHCIDIFKKKLERALRDFRPPHLGLDDRRLG